MTGRDDSTKVDGGGDDRFDGGGAETQLRSLEAVLSSTEDFVYVFDRQGRYLYANEALLDALQETLGKSPGEVMGSNFQELGYPPEAARRYQRQIQEVINSGEAVRDEDDAQDPDGTPRRLEYIFTPVFGDDGRVEAVAGITRDVTELREAAAALRQSEELYRTLFESVEQGIGVLEVLDDEDGSGDIRWLVVNERFEEQSGLSDPVGKRGRQLADDDDDSWYALHRDVIRSGEPMHLEKYAAYNRRWYEVNAVPIPPLSQRRVAVLFNDITARKHREQNVELLDELNEEFARLSRPDEIMEVVARRLGEHLEVSRVAFARVDVAEDHIENVHDWTDGSVESTVGEYRLSTLFDGDAMERLQNGAALIVENASTELSDVQQSDAYRRFGVEATVQVPHLSNGELKFLLAVDRAQPGAWRDDEIELMRDLTARLWWRLERAWVEERLREANRRKDRFLAVLSHELRNPLAPIELSLHLLEQTDPDSKQWNRAKEVIARQTEQLTRLVDDLLDVNRIDRDKIELNLQHIELNEMVGGVVEDHRGLLEDRNIELTFRPAREAVSVMGDSHRLSQVVGNLLHNVAKFTDPGGWARVCVESDEDGEFALIRVVDNGEGMAPETMENLFDPFVQADESLEHSVGGLGLGLALVKGLVELHGGGVSARSEGLGRGAEFTIRLPLERKGNKQREGGMNNKETEGGRRILIIEDNTDAVELLQSVLELKGHTVEVATSGDEGLELAFRHNPEVVICDIGLPGLSGFEVARAVRRNPDLEATRLIAISGYARPEDIKQSEEAGFDHHLAKPPDLAELDRLLGQSDKG